jgi:death-on-curing protein
VTKGPQFPPIEALLDAQVDVVAEYGGATGVRSLEGLESALARGEQLLTFSQTRPDIARLAAAIAYGLARIHHPFVDGNKRMALVALVMTLEMNDRRLDVSEREAATAIEAMANGSMSEAGFADWVAAHSFAPVIE